MSAALMMPDLQARSCGVALSWALVHTVFTLRYARAYYGDPVGGIDFNEDDPPTYLDFAYLAICVGATAQVSDPGVQSRALRNLVTAHALAAFVYNTAVLALGVNILSNLLGQ